MAWTPENSAIKVTKSLEEKLAVAENGEQIKELMRQAALSQNLVYRDFDPEILQPNEAALQPRGVSTTVTLNGVKHVLEAPTQAELDRQETAIYRAALQSGTNEPLPRDPATAEARTDAPVDTTAAVEAYLRNQGIDPQALKNISAQSYEKSWAEATQEFLAQSDWPGGTENRNALGEKILSLGLVDKPSVDSLRRAYEELKKSPNGLSENPEITLKKRIESAKSIEELRGILGQQQGGTSSIWGR